MLNVRTLPKAELHIHIEGSIEPHMMIALARKNGVLIPFPDEDAVRKACDFVDLQSFLNLFVAGLQVLRTREDFRDVTYAYLRNAHADAVRHAEMFLAAHAHLSRGIAFDDFVGGALEAMDEAQAAFGITSGLILGIQRQRTEAEGFEILERMKDYEGRLLGIGLGGPEVGNPPSKFAGLFAAARSRGWKTMAHAGEEGGPDYVREAMDILRVDRIDHGVRCEEDPELLAEIVDRQIPLTVCPVSNVRLKVVQSLDKHNLARLLRAGALVTINSDDPPYFDAFVNDNYEACRDALHLTDRELATIARNSFTASFLDRSIVAEFHSQIDRM
jgi:adenosine deaminase